MLCSRCPLGSGTVPSPFYGIPAHHLHGHLRAETERIYEYVPLCDTAQFRLAVVPLTCDLGFTVRATDGRPYGYGGSHRFLVGTGVLDGPLYTALDFSKREGKPLPYG